MTDDPRPVSPELAPREPRTAEARAADHAAIDRLADTARFSRANTPAPAEIAARITWSINHALSSLGSLDANLFGRRYPFHTFERSKSEALYGALLVVIDHVRRLTVVTRSIDAGIDERLLEGLVVSQEPLREQKMA